MKLSLYDSRSFLVLSKNYRTVYFVSRQNRKSLRTLLFTRAYRCDSMIMISIIMFFKILYGFSLRIGERKITLYKYKENISAFVNGKQCFSQIVYKDSAIQLNAVILFWWLCTAEVLKVLPLSRCEFLCGLLRISVQVLSEKIH